jgi:hypothetical protein
MLVYMILISGLSYIVYKNKTIIYSYKEYFYESDILIKYDKEENIIDDWEEIFSQKAKCI